ncbi:hypothetical protein TrLO_g9338 [Triparma laevis f. longispina]|uniref:Uncharacterized protein n=1 Tax=Triparma laevis f. longispina TaxID=1714387 RepID=A0A9W6ZM95_9STRA|nr:hypothetical protein TrLO_g9338 [Triparma laevis f. longispina]
MTSRRSLFPDKYTQSSILRRVTPPERSSEGRSSSSSSLTSCSSPTPLTCFDFLRSMGSSSHSDSTSPEMVSSSRGSSSDDLPDSPRSSGILRTKKEKKKTPSTKVWFTPLLEVAGKSDMGSGWWSRTDLNYFRLRELYAPTFGKPPSPKIPPRSFKPIVHDRHNPTQTHQLYIPTYKAQTKN